MNAARLLIVALVKLATLAAFVWLTLHGFAAWAWPLLLLFLATRLPPAAAPATSPAKPPAVASVPSESAAA